MNVLNQLPSRVILYGGTGQAKVVRPIIEANGARVVAVFDDTPGLKPPFSDVALYEGWNEFENWIAKQDVGDLGFCIAIGNPHGRVRLKLHQRMLAKGLKAITVAHATAWISKTAKIGQGCQIMAGAIVGDHAVLGRQCIINTKASVDHDDLLADGAELAPGATLCGEIVVDTAGWICAGATVLPRVHIGADAIVGAGAVVIRDVPAGCTVVGVPAKEINRTKDKH